MAEINNDTNHQTGLASESAAQQMVELQQPLLSSPPAQLPEGDEVTTNIQVMVQSCGDGLRSQDCCIYRVPITLRHRREEAYIPKVVSIGPFHYGDKRLQDMERHKQILFKRFTQRATLSSLDDLVGLVKQLEPRIRASYSDPINLSEQQLVELTLVDAGFIIELFIMYYFMANEEVKDAKLSQRWLANSVGRDLSLLENQLPYFVIEELFDKAFPYRGSLPSFLELTYAYFDYVNVQPLLDPNPDDKIRHFTDLIRLFYVKGKLSQRHEFSDEVGRHILSYNAKALQEAGIKLKVSYNTMNSLDLKFSGHVLEIPQISVTAITEMALGNIIALEQCHYPYDGYITDFALMMDFLIDTNEDVDLLVHDKIIRNYIGNPNNVASLFSGLSEHVAYTNFNSEYLDICKKLNGYCEDPWNKKKATLRHDYCRTPWQIVASVAAIVLLILTVVQTIFSILQVVK